MPKHPLPAEEAEYLQERLSEWGAKLRLVCDQYKADNALADALRSDINPEYQHWGLEDSGWRLGGRGQRHRVGNPGLRGRSAEDVGRAVALSKMTRPLPLIAEARLAYEVGDVRAFDDHVSEPIEPWNGQEFEGVEWVSDEDIVQQESRLTYTLFEHRVVYYWDGCRYQVEDVADGQFVRVKDGAHWRDATSKEQESRITRRIRKYETVDELLARRDQWVAEVWADRKADWSGSGMGAIMARASQPDGVPESEVVAAFDAMVERLRHDPEARDEQDDVARARQQFKLWLRRRP